MKGAKIIAFCFLFGIGLLTAITTETQRILPQVSSENQFFGSSIACFGERLVIGARKEGGVGAVYIYEKNGNLWQQTERLAAPAGIGAVYFGRSVAVSGDYLAVGADTNLIEPVDVSYVFLYRFRNGMWEYVTTLTSPLPAGADHFGKAVAMNGNTLAVSAYYDSETVAQSGCVYIYHNVDDNWVLQQKVKANDISASSFGYSLALDDSLLAVGAIADATMGTKAGAAYIFRNNGLLWQQEAKVYGTGILPYDGFGWAVAIKQETAVVSTFVSQNYDDGVAFVFTKRDGSWSETSLLTPPYPHPNPGNMGFGMSLALSADALLVCAMSETLENVDAGAGYLYTKQNGDWILSDKLCSSLGIDHAELGFAATIIDNYVFIGAWQEDIDAFPNAGAVYFFDLTAVDATDEHLPSPINSLQNYPNPFNPQTTIAFSLSQPEKVQLGIYDIKGRLVKSFTPEKTISGKNTVLWNGTDKQNKNVGSGIYFVNLKTKTGRQTHKIVLLK